MMYVLTLFICLACICSCTDVPKVTCLDYRREFDRYQGKLRVADCVRILEQREEIIDTFVNGAGLVVNDELDLYTTDSTHIFVAYKQVKATTYKGTKVELENIANQEVYGIEIEQRKNGAVLCQETIVMSRDYRQR